MSFVWKPLPLKDIPFILRAITEMVRPPCFDLVRIVFCINLLPGDASMLMEKQGVRVVGHAAFFSDVNGYCFVLCAPSFDRLVRRYFPAFPRLKFATMRPVSAPIPADVWRLGLDALGDQLMWSWQSWQIIGTSYTPASINHAK